MTVFSLDTIFQHWLYGRGVFELLLDFSILLGFCIVKHFFSGVMTMSYFTSDNRTFAVTSTKRCQYPIKLQKYNACDDVVQNFT